MRNRNCRKNFGWLIGLLLMLCSSNLYAVQDSVKLTVRLRGVYDSKITITPYRNGLYKEPLKELAGVQTEVTMAIPKAYLPGQFLLRMDYRKQAADQPYPSEFIFFLNKDDLTIGINPLHTQPDSVRLKNDQENTAYFSFMQENVGRRQQLIILEQVLAEYQPKGNRFYRDVEKEFEQKRTKYNEWIDQEIVQNQDLFVSRIFTFQKAPGVDWYASPEDHLKQQGEHYFDEIDFQDTLLLRTQAFNQYVTTYMRMFGMQATSKPLQDSLFTLAGRIACEKASAGHPKVYGWMVDYFYQGFEALAIDPGIKMLAKHIQDPRCLTSKKQEILRRLDGMKKLVVGAKAPAFEAEMANEMQVRFKGISKDKDYGLLVFYDSACLHCKELLRNLHKWYAEPEHAAWLDVITLSVDDVRSDWESFHRGEDYAWTDLWASGGINSQLANDYYILSTPVMFIIDAENNILHLPQSIDEVNQFIFGN
ncbi:thioredoxin-like domain-containing protein [Sunxiuqinia elliptica]|uniref:AhpC/TSA family protein n=1 Tax=Sunxiuqinia elliptica TaxID=655355 RepID=A0A1I2C484_9BACT|nr:thioredoxin-like domain-containing protein [Sunxiuqinia elliptica]SFE63008.1 AhpC/TSA family protein [Sunxiuqinia elliptica]